MTSRRLDLPSLVAGVGLLVFGAVLLADAVNAIDLSFAALAPLACFLVGDILLAAGLTRRD
jgi:membrane-bound ClpP family serine protease